MRPTTTPRERDTVSTRALRPLLGAAVTVRTFAATWRGTLLSCVKDSAWLVVDDADIVLRLNEIVSIQPADRLAAVD
ncbi:MAG TPA: hypothetical protein VGJ86_10195 [Acidimicrobiales bacterium]|jgi:hypothetical protein